MNSDLIELLAVFEKNGVKYLIVGGYAVGFHAEPRYTKDCDIWIATDRRNAEAVYASLVEFHAPLHGATAKDFEDEDAFFFFGAPPNRIDLLMSPPGAPPFTQAWRRRVVEDIQGRRINIVSRRDLIAMKEAARRPRDLLDLRALAASDPARKQNPAKRQAAKTHPSAKPKTKSRPSSRKPAGGRKGSKATKRKAEAKPKPKRR